MIKKFLQLAGIACIVLLTSLSSAHAYGGYGYHYGHGYSGYHHGFHARYHSHGGIGTAGAVVLGLLGVAVLTHILDDDRYDRHTRVARRTSLPRYSRRTAPLKAYPRINNQQAGKSFPVYGSNEGWESLKAGNSGKAMSVFAVQSQQNLHSAVPKIGFSLAAAANDETERAIWSMRRAVKHDPGALDQIVVDSNLDNVIDKLDRRYTSQIENKTEQPHAAFMVAALSYLQRDIDRARDYLSPKDRSASTTNLRRLITLSDRDTQTDRN